MTRGTLVIAVVLMAGAAPMRAWQQADWEQRAEARAEELTRRNGPGTDAALRSELLAMREKDQGVRQRMLAEPPDRRGAFEAELDAVDRTLTARLKQIVAAKGWPTLALVGSEASGGAILILIHSPDHAWQEQLLPELQRLVEADKIMGSDVAILTDKLLMSKGVPQRFGSQFKIEGDEMVMWPVEDPAHLEERRAQYLLPPMSVYREMLASMYHMRIRAQ